MHIRTENTQPAPVVCLRNQALTPTHVITEWPRERISVYGHTVQATLCCMCGDPRTQRSFILLISNKWKYTGDRSALSWAGRQIATNNVDNILTTKINIRFLLEIYCVFIIILLNPKQNEKLYFQTSLSSVLSMDKLQYVYSFDLLYNFKFCGKIFISNPNFDFFFLFFFLLISSTIAKICWGRRPRAHL